MRSALPALALALALALLLAACASRTPAPAPPPSRPAPPAILSPIHQNISPLEQSFHLRAGFNVAALSCVSQTGPAIVSDYNRFLAAKKVQLAAAYDAKADRYRAQGGQWQRALDTHMTQLYNHFASPTAQAEFCRVAAAEVKRAIAADPDGFTDWAVGALARIDAPIATARPAMLAARAIPMAPVAAMAPMTTMAPLGTMPPMAAAVPAAALPAGWRIELGAFAGRAAAEAAWKEVAGRSPAIGGMAPHFEPVRGGGPVRLQVKGVESRDQAIQLCAHAAAAGFDCLPVAPA